MFPKTLAKAIVLTMLTGSLLIGSATPMQAYDNCARRIYKAERNLERAIQRHGLHSIEAERRRDQLERARARCHRGV